MYSATLVSACEVAWQCDDILETGDMTASCMSALATMYLVPGAIITQGTYLICNRQIGVLQDVRVPARVVGCKSYSLILWERTERTVHAVREYILNVDTAPFMITPYPPISGQASQLRIRSAVYVLI